MGRCHRAVLTNVSALTCRFLCLSPPHPPTHPTPIPLFPLIFHRKTTPSTPRTGRTPSPSPRDTNRNSHPFAKTTPPQKTTLSLLRARTEFHEARNDRPNRRRKHMYTCVTDVMRVKDQTLKIRFADNLQVSPDLMRAQESTLILRSIA